MIITDIRREKLREKRRAKKLRRKERKKEREKERICVSAISAISKMLDRKERHSAQDIEEGQIW